MTKRDPGNQSSNWNHEMEEEENRRRNQEQELASPQLLQIQEQKQKQTQELVPPQLQLSTETLIIKTSAELLKKDRGVSYSSITLTSFNTPTHEPPIKNIKYCTPELHLFVVPSDNYQSYLDIFDPSYIKTLCLRLEEPGNEYRLSYFGNKFRNLENLFFSCAGGRFYIDKNCPGLNLNISIMDTISECPEKCYYTMSEEKPSSTCEIKFDLNIELKELHIKSCTFNTTKLPKIKTLSVYGCNTSDSEYFVLSDVEKVSIDKSIEYLEITSNRLVEVRTSCKTKITSRNKFSLTIVNVKNNETIDLSECPNIKEIEDEFNIERGYPYMDVNFKLSPELKECTLKTSRLIDYKNYDSRITYFIDGTCKLVKGIPFGPNMIYSNKPSHINLPIGNDVFYGGLLPSLNPVFHFTNEEQKVIIENYYPCIYEKSYQEDLRDIFGISPGTKQWNDYETKTDKERILYNIKRWKKFCNK